MKILMKREFNSLFILKKNNLYYIVFKMGKRGRKPKEKTERSGYFYETEEDAFVDYLTADNKEEKDRIFNTYLHPAFTKMIESIIRRYNLYPPDEEFQETFDDTISFLMTKVEKFNPDAGYKAYSYCGTICKNYLLFKINQFLKNQKRNESYDLISNEINENIKFSYDQYGGKLQILNELIQDTISEISEMLEKKETLKLNETQIKVGKALIELMTNWEDLFARMGSDKFNKSSILLFLKETTLLSTKEIRDAMKVYKLKYYNLKRNVLENNS